MTEYCKYQHVEKIGCTEVDGILLGDVYVFPKIDGTNAHAWFDGEKMRYGSRRRELSLDSDNAGFMAAMVDDENLTSLCKANQNVHVFGEWLVPHSLKTYRDDAWRRFYVFDMVEFDGEDASYIHYDELSNACQFHGVEYIAPIRIIKNPTIDNIMRVLDDNTYLIKDGSGAGEGVVLKNYNFVNRFGRIKWAKVVTSEFKEKHHKMMGAPITTGTKMVEDEIVLEFITTALVEKTVAKITVECDGWRSQYIPRLLQTVFYDLVTEHSWDMVKRWKNPTIDYKNLSRFCTMKIKELKPELF